MSHMSHADVIGGLAKAKVLNKPNAQRKRHKVSQSQMLSCNPSVPLEEFTGTMTSMWDRH